MVRAHEHAAGAKGGRTVRRWAAPRGGFSTKLHLRCDGNGLPLAIVLTPGQTHEARIVDILVEDMAPGTRCLIGDMGYDADRIRQDLLRRVSCRWSRPTRCGRAAYARPRAVPPRPALTAPITAASGVAVFHVLRREQRHLAEPEQSSHEHGQAETDDVRPSGVSAAAGTQAYLRACWIPVT